jgi:phosphomannomutase
MDNELKFGTSGLRDTVDRMTDRECYINTRGFIEFLRERGEITSDKALVAIGGDLRNSTARIMAAVSKAVNDAGCDAISCGRLPSPALAYYGIKKGIPSIMVTGSHIPEDRNGIKFTKKSGEVLKSDEADILKNVAGVRSFIMNDSISGLFDETGMFVLAENEPRETADKEAVEFYVERYTKVFPSNVLKGLKIVFYQHSAVGRDMIKRILEELGAEVITVARSEKFVPVDTEKISKETLALLKKWAAEYKPFAIFSTDGDSDRPLVADGSGNFIPGDKLGALVSLYLGPDFAAVPVSANDAVLKALSGRGVKVVQTKIGSPYVVKAMEDETSSFPGSKVVSWESNGGFLLGSSWNIDGKVLDALPTRDAVLPVIALLLLAKGQGVSVEEIVEKNLPSRYTDAGVADSSTPGCLEYSAEVGKKIIEFLTPAEKNITQVDFDGEKVTVSGCDARENDIRELKDIKKRLGRYFEIDKELGEINSINFIDGIKAVFKNGDVAHLRPSGNAPEFRVYATSDSKERAEGIVSLKDRLIPAMMKDVLPETDRALSAAASPECEIASEIVDFIKKGNPFTIEPHTEPKVWGVNGVGEFWYGPGIEGKSSIAVVAGQRVKMDDLVSALAKDLLGPKVLEKFGVMAPLVKILTPKGRLSVQFHDSKNELWIVTSCDGALADGKNWIILGFSPAAVKKYGKDVIIAYEKALTKYGEGLNSLLDAIEAEGEKGKTLLREKKDILAAAEELVNDVPGLERLIKSFLESRKGSEFFYSYRSVEPGDVIPVPSGTLHALGPGVFVIEPQISGPTQSLEDGTTYPVRYYFPGYQREGALKRLDIERSIEMKPEVTSDAAPEIIEKGEGYVIERLPGNFADKGLEARRITIESSYSIRICDNLSMHSMVVSKGKAFVSYDGRKYSIPEARPGGAMMIIPASCRGYDIIASDRSEIIDTFTPV